MRAQSSTPYFGWRCIINLLCTLRSFFLWDTQDAQVIGPFFCGTRRVHKSLPARPFHVFLKGATHSSGSQNTFTFLLLLPSRGVVRGGDERATALIISLRSPDPTFVERALRMKKCKITKRNRAKRINCASLDQHAKPLIEKNDHTLLFSLWLAISGSFK